MPGEKPKVLYCINNAPPKARALLASLDPPCEPRDCFGCCVMCFEKPFLVLEHPGPGTVESRQQIIDGRSHEKIVERLGLCANPTPTTQG